MISDETCSPRSFDGAERFRNNMLYGGKGMSGMVDVLDKLIGQRLDWSWSLATAITTRPTLTGIRTSSLWWACAETRSWTPSDLVQISGNKIKLTGDNRRWYSGYYIETGGESPSPSLPLRRIMERINWVKWGRKFFYRTWEERLPINRVSFRISNPNNAYLYMNAGWDVETDRSVMDVWGWGCAPYRRYWSAQTILGLVIPKAVVSGMKGDILSYGTWISNGAEAVSNPSAPPPLDLMCFSDGINEPKDYEGSHRHGIPSVSVTAPGSTGQGKETNSGGTTTIETLKPQQGVTPKAGTSLERAEMNSN